MNLSRPTRHPVTLSALFGAYFLLGMLGLSYDTGATVMWPPAGFALAAVLIWGRGIWPAIFGGAFLSHAWHTGDPVAALGIAAGAVIESVIGAALVDRYAAGVKAFDRPATIFRFTGLAAGISTTVGASCATAAMAGSVALPVFSELAYLWTSWWLGHVTGVLVITPLVLLWWNGGIRLTGWTRVPEGIGLIGLLVTVSLLVFAGRLPSATKTLPLEFLCVPFILWAAFRFGPRITATVITILAGFAVWGTLNQLGPFFVAESLNLSKLVMQAYIGVTSVMSAVLAAALEGQRRAEARLHELAITDPLTGLANYRHLLDRMRAEITRSGRTGRPFAVVLLDLDGLKAINDRYGHLTGSRAICRVGDVLRRTSRATDTPARYGGDEFAVVLPESGRDGGERLLVRISQLLAADPETPTLAVSGGVAIYPDDGDSTTLLLRSADAALYEAKARKGAARHTAPADDQARRA